MSEPSSIEEELGPYDPYLHAQIMEQKLAIAVEALEFYAKEYSWQITAENEFSQIKRTISKEDSESWSYQSSPESKSIVQCVGGKLAREALAKIRGVE